jgi:hypothetical protein
MTPQDREKAKEVIARELRTLEIYLTNPDMITQWDRIKSTIFALTVALQVMEKYKEK